MDENELIRLIDKDVPEIGSITQEMVQCTLAYSNQFRGSVRASTGKIYTDEEYAARRDRVLGTPLP